MSTNIIFTVPGRTTNYMPVDVNTPKEVLLEKYARDSFSTENSWPFESPSAGYYDITNSDTKLILLNKRITWSHLRGKTKAKREPFVKDQYYDWVEREIEMKAQSERKSSDSSRDQSASKRTTDPSRHFSATGCTFRPQFKEDSQNSFKSKGLSKSVYNWTKPRTSVTESYKNTIAKNDDEEAELIKYFYEMSTQKAGLQDKTHVQNPPYEFLNSYNINHPDLKKGQKLFLNNLCQVYSVAPLKKLKETQYLSLLEKQKQIDKFSRDKFRMHDGENFQKYQEFIKTERPVPNQINCGYFHPKQVKSANTTNYSSYKKGPYKSKGSKFDSTSFMSTSTSSQSRSNFSSSSQSSSSYSSSSTSKSEKSDSQNNEKRQGNVLSDLSNTDYENSSTSSQISNSKSSNSYDSSETGTSETSRSLSQISHLSDGFNTKSSSMIESKFTLDYESTKETDSDKENNNESTLIDNSSSSESSRPSSSSSSILDTARSEFMNSSTVNTTKSNTLSNAQSDAKSNAQSDAQKSNKKNKPIQIIQKPEEEEE